MTTRPLIFISAVSRELRSARQLVANTLTFLGYEPVWQEIFGTESGDLRQMLREKIDACQGVVQLVGHAYGAEPPAPDEEFGRVSYTQYEALYARKRGKKVWYLFMDKGFPIDSHEPEPAELVQLQTSYREGLKIDSHLFHPLASKEALEAGVLKLRDDLTQLRRGARRWAIGIAALLVVIALMSLWLIRGQEKTARGMEKIALHFDSISAGGLIANPKTPEEHYHNARIHELDGNFAAARKSYADYLEANLEALDPWLSYAAMLKAQEGRDGALASFRALGEKLDPATVSYRTALATFADGDERIAKLKALASQHPDYGPLPWLIAQEYSETRRGQQTIADQRAEKEWLEKFRAARAAGRFEKFFLDKKEAQKWIETADARWAMLTSTPDQVLENPVSLTAQQSSAGWAVIFNLTDSRATDLLYQLDGAGEFKSTGHLPSRNPQTGQPAINPHLPLPNLAPGEHTMLVKYVDKNGQTNGPYTLQFSTADEQLAQGKMMLNSVSGAWLSFRDWDSKVLLYFTTLMSYRPIIKEVRYSLNSEAVDKTFEFPPSDKMFEVGDMAAQVPPTLYLAVPPDTEFASVQVTYKDGTTSPIQKVVRQK